MNCSVLDIPQDESLPGLANLLDLDRFMLILRPHLEARGIKIVRGEISYIRYKPSTNCLAAYRLILAGAGSNSERETILYAKLFCEKDFKNAWLKSASSNWVKIDDFDPVMALPTESAMLYFYPNDCLIDGLKILAQPKKMQRILYANYHNYSSSEWRISDSKLKVTTVRYKPERRAVVRCDTKATRHDGGDKKKISIYCRFYGDERGRQAYDIQRALFEMLKGQRRVKVPMPIAYIPEKRLLIMEAVPGQPLEKLLAGSDQQAIERAAEALARLHEIRSLDLPVRDSQSAMSDLESTAEMIRAVAPESIDSVTSTLHKIKTGLLQVADASTTFVHGDFYYGQVLVHEEGAFIIDYDRSYLGDPLADLGNFCAHLRLLRLENRVADEIRSEEAFIGKYEAVSGRKANRDSLGLWTAVGLFQLSIGPFRRLESGWRKKTDRILQECQKALLK